MLVIATVVAVDFSVHSIVDRPIAVVESSSPKSLWSQLVGLVAIVVLVHWLVCMLLAVQESSWPRSQQSLLVVELVLHQQKLSAIVVIAFAFIGFSIAFGSFAVG